MRSATHVVRLGMSRLFITVGLLLGVCSAADANVVCVTNSASGGPLRVRPACKPNETELGSVTALQALLASSSKPNGGTTLQLTGDIQIATPISGSTASAAREVAAAPQTQSPGDDTHFCVGGGFPGALGSQFACSSDAQCHVCVAGNPPTLGSACTTDPGCDSANMGHGRCALNAACQEFAVLAIHGSQREGEPHRWIQRQQRRTQPYRVPQLDRR